MYLFLKCHTKHIFSYASSPNLSLKLRAMESWEERWVEVMAGWPRARMMGDSSLAKGKGGGIRVSEVFLPLSSFTGCSSVKRMS